MIGSMRSKGMIVMVPWLAAACSDTPTVEGNATISVLDYWGVRGSNASMYSTAGGTQLASATSDTNGTAVLGVATDSEVTMYMTDLDGPGLYSLTVFGIDPDIAAQFPINAAFNHPPPTGETYAGVSTGGVDFGGATDLWGWAGFYCPHVEMVFDTSISVPACNASTGTWTVTAALFDADGNVVGFHDQADLGNGGTTITLTPWADVVKGEVSADFANPFTGSGATSTTNVEYVRNGQLYGLSWGEDAVASPGTHYDAELPDPDLATGLHQQIQTATDTTFRFAEQYVTSTTSISLDVADTASPPASVRVELVDGAPEVTIEDVATNALSTWFTVRWMGPDGVPHQFTGYAEPPAGAGERVFRMPPVPAGFESYLPPTNVTLTASAGYNQSDYAPTDWRLAPEPYVPGLITTGQRSFSSVSSGSAARLSSPARPARSLRLPAAPPDRGR